MDITPQISVDAKVIQSYGPAGFQISPQVYRCPVIVLPERVLEWPIADVAALSATDFTLLQDVEPPVEVVLLGCGATGMLLPARLRAELKAFCFSVDAMDTGAACRTYNVMLAESRRVAAALVPG